MFTTTPNNKQTFFQLFLLKWRLLILPIIPAFIIVSLVVVSFSTTSETIIEWRDGSVIQSSAYAPFVLIFPFFMTSAIIWVLTNRRVDTFMTNFPMTRSLHHWSNVAVITCMTAVSTLLFWSFYRLFPLLSYTLPKETLLLSSGVSNEYMLQLVASAFATLLLLNSVLYFATQWWQGAKWSLLLVLGGLLVIQLFVQPLIPSLAISRIVYFYALTQPIVLLLVKYIGTALFLFIAASYFYSHKEVQR